jgi:hypothetical protein
MAPQYEEGSSSHDIKREHLTSSASFDGLAAATYCVPEALKSAVKEQLENHLCYLLIACVHYSWLYCHQHG